MSNSTFFPKSTSINFTVKNELLLRTVTIFNFILFPGDVKDLLEIPEISEADIRHSLIKGDLNIKLRNGSLSVVSSTIDLMQFDPEQQQFLIDLGIPAYGVKPEEIIEIGKSLYLKLDPIVDEDAPNNSVYIADDGQLSFKDENGEFGPVSSGAGGGTGPYSFIQFDQESSAEVQVNSIYVDSESGDLVFNNHNDDTIVIHQADNGTQSSYLSLQSYTGMMPNSTLFANGNNEGVLSYRKSNGDVINLEAGGGGSVDFNSVNSALGDADATVKINYKRLNEVGHPIPTYNHGATTVGWAKSQFLKTVNVTVSTDTVEPEMFDEVITLQPKRWQAVAVINKEYSVTINLPEEENIHGNSVIVYLEAGSTCAVINWTNGDEHRETYIPPGYATEFVYNAEGDSWIDTGHSYAEMVNIVNKNVAIDSGMVNIFFPKYAQDTQLSGTYHGDVIVVGSAHINGNLDIYGNLIISGDLYNDNGYRVEIQGDLNFDELHFDANENTFEQYSLTVYGDLIGDNIEFSVCRYVQEGESHYPSLIVGGDIIINGSIDGPGTDGAPGLNIDVKGNIYAGDSIYLSGGDSTPDFAAGDGGYLQCYGTMIVYHFESYGGDSANMDRPAGRGGDVEIYGNFIGSLYLDGGDAQNGESSESLSDAGVGGSIEITGDARIQEISSVGGYCLSNNPQHTAGYGGNLEVGGNLFVSEGSYIDLAAGERGGTLTGYYPGSAPSGGQIEVSGTIYAANANIRITGGEINTNDFTNSSEAGSGGSIECGGDFYHGSVYTNGGDNTFAGGGEGGHISVRGNLIGAGEYGIFTYGGNGITIGESSQEPGAGGDGGFIEIGGDAFTYIDAHGGNGWNDDGGDAGDITCKGNLYLSSCNVDGGTCTSMFTEHNAGEGAYINVVKDFNCDGTIAGNGGNRHGNTTEVGYTGGGNGAYIEVEHGNLTANVISINGGISQCTYKNGNGGTGGDILVSRGNISINNVISADGGLAYGGEGGRGGTVFCLAGTANIKTVNLKGGSSQEDSETTQGLPGYGGILKVHGGCNIEVATLEDGSVGNGIPTGITQISLAGNCNFGTIQMFNRGTDTRIKKDEDTNKTTLVSVMSFTDKQSFNNGDNSETPNYSTFETPTLLLGMGSGWHPIPSSGNWE